ncbi:MAG: ABC transporter ATP-binding protein [Desulfurococcales archaeon]|nr:ABC transporter ATP-binding protein [Desulfurococcales archaeon]
MHYAIILQEVVKKIKDKVILDRINLRVPNGSLYVIAGPNGSGKTTTIRVILGLYSPNSGRVEVLGRRPRSQRWQGVLQRIGYLPEDASPYERLTGYENLLFYAKLYAMGDESKTREYFERGVELSGLSHEELRMKTGEYSKGMKRRLLLAMSLMHDPDLALLDEPTSGLDVFSSYRIREWIRNLVRRGKTVVVTTHNMLEAETIADHIAFIVNGRVVFSGRVDEALERYRASSLEEAFIRASSPSYRDSPSTVAS